MLHIHSMFVRSGAHVAHSQWPKSSSPVLDVHFYISGHTTLSVSGAVQNQWQGVDHAASACMTQTKQDPPFKTLLHTLTRLCFNYISTSWCLIRIRTKFHIKTIYIQMQWKPRMYFDAGNFMDMGTETSIWPWGETPPQVMADNFFFLVPVSLGLQCLSPWH